MFDEVRVGAEIDGYCTKCRMVTNHRIVAIVDDVVKRVICLTCEGQHNYRQPPGEKKASSGGAKRVARDQKRSRTSSPKTFQKWLDLKGENQDEVTGSPYSMSETYEAGEAIFHAKFGLGFVQKVLPGNKIEVMFEKEIKTLAMNYRTSS